MGDKEKPNVGEFYFLFNQLFPVPEPATPCSEIDWPSLVSPGKSGVVVRGPSHWFEWKE